VPTVSLSRRAEDALKKLRETYDFVSPGERTYLLHTTSGHPEWWTFAGFAANSALAEGLADLVDEPVGDLRLRLKPHVNASELGRALESRADSLPDVRPGVDDAALEGLKFSCRDTGGPRPVAERLADPSAVRVTVRAPLREVRL
jgi:ATP-dependent Lhr-like helicase